MSDKSASDKFTAARCRLMTCEPWYGHMALSIEWRESEFPWVEDEDAKTLGFRITSQSVVQGFYYADWVNKTPLEKIYGAIEHGINHLVRLHTLRQMHREPAAWNIATDMAVNGHKSSPHIGYDSSSGSGKVLPDEKMVFVPQDWPDDESAEYYYDRILEETNQNQQGQGQNQDQQGQGEGQGQGQGGDEEGEGQGQGGGGDDGDGEQEEQEEQQGESQYSHGDFGGSAVDNHDVWSQSEVSQDMARQLVNDMTKEATEKSQGHAPGHLKQILDELATPIIRWREMLRQYLGTHVGNRRKTFSRADRRTRQFGIKGVSHHAAATVSVVVDTSGSIGNDELEQFFAEIEAISYRAKVFVLQWDAQFQGFDRYRRGDWKNIEIGGRGGTDMVAPVVWLEENGAVGDVMIMLTDGYCQWPDERKFPALYVITTDVEGPDWGHVIRMKAYE